MGLLAAMCLVAMALLASDAFAAQPPVGLGTAETFAVLAGSTVTSTGSSTINGDLGVSPGTAVTGFPPGTVSGTIHAADAVAGQAQADLTTAYNDAAGRTGALAVPADLGGRTLTPGVYRSGSSLRLTGTLTLDARGDPDAVFVFQAGSTLTTAPGSHVNLINGARPCNVSWQIGSSATLGTSSVFAGNILALTSISVNDGVTLNGRALARNGAVTMINDTITAAQCATGGGTTGGGTTGGGTTGGGTTGGGTTGGGTTGACATAQTPTDPAAKRSPARPVLLSPRSGGRVRAGAVQFRWRPAGRAAGYTLMVDRHRMNTGCATKAVMRVRAGSHRYRVIARNPYGAQSSRVLAFSAIDPPSADMIRRGLGLDVFNKEVIAAAERITLRAAEAAAFRSALRSLGKFATKASIVGFLVSIGLDDGNINCERGPLYKRARPAFKGAADVLSRAARARIGPHRADLAKLARVRSALKRLKTWIDKNPVTDECDGPGQVALQTIKLLQPRLDAAGARFEEQAALKDFFNRNNKTKANPYGFQSRNEARLSYRNCRKYKSRDECTSIAIIFPGDDTPEVTRHELTAITVFQQPPLLHWVVPAARARKGWYKKLRVTPCTSNTLQGSGKQCDEYPFLSTREGGPGASLQPVSQADNSRHGGRVNQFYSVCHLRQQGKRFLVVPLPAAVHIPTRYACNGTR